MAGIKGRSGRRPGDAATLWADALRIAVTTVARKPLREMTDEEIAARIAELEAQSTAH